MGIPGGTPCTGLYGEAPLERVFSALAIYEGKMNLDVSSILKGRTKPF